MLEAVPPARAAAQDMGHGLPVTASQSGERTVRTPALNGPGARSVGFFGALPFAWSLLIVPVLAAMALDAVPEFIPWVIPWVVLPLLPYMTLTGLLVKRGVPVLDTHTPRSRLFWHTAVLWAWMLSYPSVVILTIWSVANSPSLTVYERIALVAILVQVSVFCVSVGHEMLHRRDKWTRRLGDVLMSVIAMPHWYTEHLYVHHPHVATPLDYTRPAQGQSFHDFFLKTSLISYVEAARLQCGRLARRGLPVWHLSNPCWRWAAKLALWIGLSLTIAGWLGLAVWVLQALHGMYTVRVLDYMQHYGLQRCRLPNGRYEQVRPHHSWSFSDSMDYLLFCSQRHSDHHQHPARPYPLLQDYPEEVAPRFPADYRAMALLAHRPSAWFRKMDPLIDEWRSRFYPNMGSEDWRALCSRAYRERPASLPVIAETFRSTPRLADWMERRPLLLDGIEGREFQQLIIPENIGLEPDVALAAQRGLLRLYYTREFGREEMTAELALSGVETSEDVVESVQFWSNACAFQAGVRTMRGDILPVDAGLPLSNMAEVAISAVARSVLDDLKSRYGPVAASGVAIAALGRLGDRRMTMRSDVELLLLYEGTEPGDGRFAPDDHAAAMCGKLNALLADLAEESLLLRSVAMRPPCGQRGNAGAQLEALAGEKRDADTLAEVASARLVHVTGEGAAGLERHFHRARRTVLMRHADAAVHELPGQRPQPGAGDPSLSSILNGPGGLADILLATLLLRLRSAEEHPPILKAEGVSEVFKAAGELKAVDTSVADDLVDAARLWLNLDGVRPLVVDGDLEESGLDDSCRAMIARACDAGSIDELQVLAMETARRTAAHIDALMEAA